MQIDFVDVFGAAPLRGNPVAVVHGAEFLNEAEMLALTQWLGFSETTFLLPPTDARADYRVRIFYPAGELPFAGHPTLGICHAWMKAGGRPKSDELIVQECGIGLVEVKRGDSSFAFSAPQLSRSGPLTDAERSEAIRIAGVDPAYIVDAVHVANGPDWQLLRLRSAENVLSASPLNSAPAGTCVGLAAPAAAGEDGADWEVRAFFTNYRGTLVEDPVTGSFNAGLAVHLLSTGTVHHGYMAAQGRMTGADGRVECSVDGHGTIWIGGACTTIAEGATLTAFDGEAA